MDALITLVHQHPAAILAIACAIAVIGVAAFDLFFREGHRLSR